MLTYLRHFFTHNWYLKLFSLLLAFLLWFTIASETISVINRTVPLEFQEIPPNTEITGETTTQVSLQLRGSSSLLNEMPPAAVTAAISLAGEPPGEKTFFLSQADIEAPFGVEVIRIDPPQIQFALEQTLRRTLPVDHNVEGEPAEGYLVEGIFVVPATVDVVGPESSVAPLESLTTTAIRIDGETSSIREFVDLNLLDPLVRLETLERPEVFVQILEEQTTETLSIPLDPSLATAGWDTGTASVEATLSGPRSLMANLDPSGLFFTFETDGLEAGTHQVSPELVGLEEEFSVVALTPETVSVLLEPR